MCCGTRNCCCDKVAGEDGLIITNAATGRAELASPNADVNSRRARGLTLHRSPDAEIYVC